MFTRGQYTNGGRMAARYSVMATRRRLETAYGAQVKAQCGRRRRGGRAAGEAAAASRVGGEYGIE